ncbi:unnamed protein product [Effrenium voratum]|uniref:Uncharacterized protein n=1 Tax=Effrenium voratum TaxID=2562239 RepID=A0AA36IUJ9_9DINO|nr:unnamed protein product [Effrenium voratum]
MATSTGQAVRETLLDGKVPLPPRAGSKHGRRGAFLKSTTRRDLDDHPENAADESPKVNEHLTRPGQSIVDALKETAAGVQGELEKHFPGWTPARDMAAQVHQKKKLDQARRDKGLDVEGAEEKAAPMVVLTGASLIPPILRERTNSPSPSPRGSGSATPAPEDPKEEEVKKQMDKAGEPGSIFWSPHIMRAQIGDILEQLNTVGMEELLSEQLEFLHSVVARNAGLARSLTLQDDATKDHHEGVQSMVDGLSEWVDKSQKKTEVTLYGCQDKGQRMADLINAAILERERVRQLLLSDADIVVTEEKKLLLEERRRQGQELKEKVLLMKRQEEELGYGGIQEPAAIAELRGRIERKTKKQAKLKAEHELVQARLKSMEQALEAVERGDRQDKSKALDQHAMETIEEAKGHARETTIAPLLEQMKREQELHTPQPIELPEEMVFERDSLQRQIDEVEGEIASIENLHAEWEGQRMAAINTIKAIEDEDEQRLAGFSVKRRRSYLGIMQVEPPLVAPMPPFEVEQAPAIKAGLYQRCRQMQEEMQPLLEELPQYLALVANAKQTAKEIGEQREKFVEHIRSLKFKFLKDLRTGGAKKMANQDINTKLDEEVLMKQVEDMWDSEEAKLCEGHLALQHRAGFFEAIEGELTEEITKLQEAAERNRWAYEDKIEAAKEEKEEPQPEQEGIDLDAFLALEEDKDSFLAKVMAAYRKHDQTVLESFIEEAEEAEQEGKLQTKEDIEKKKVLREVFIAELTERRNSMVALGTTDPSKLAMLAIESCSVSEASMSGPSSVAGSRRNSQALPPETVEPKKGEVKRTRLSMESSLPSFGHRLSQDAGFTRTISDGSNEPFGPETDLAVSSLEHPTQLQPIWLALEKLCTCLDSS